MFEFETLIINEEDIHKIEITFGKRLNIEKEIVYISKDEKENIIGYVSGVIFENIGYITDIHMSTDRECIEKVETALLSMIVDYFKTKKCVTVYFQVSIDNPIAKKYGNENLYNIFE